MFKTMFRSVQTLFYLVLAVCAVLAVTLAMTQVPANTTVSIAQGAGVRSVAKDFAKQTQQSSLIFELGARIAVLTGGIKLKSGKFTLETSQNAYTLWGALADAEVAMTEVKIIDGWNFVQLRKMIDEHPSLRHETKGLTQADLMQKIGMEGVHPEGRFYPDTYKVAEDSSDIAVLKLAAAQLRKQVTKVWASRPSDSPLKSEEELLILASIVEKETGNPKDRGMVSSVFHNRLRIGMLLQTDPTVIYGMGERYAGKIRKSDLTEDTPYNTYTRAGLPPTPIAMVGLAAIQAAMQPDASKALYFVAKGKVGEAQGGAKGESYFSENLAEHNRAVAKYILGR